MCNIWWKTYNQMVLKLHGGLKNVYFDSSIHTGGIYQNCIYRRSGRHLDIKALSYQYMDSHYTDIFIIWIPNPRKTIFILKPPHVISIHSFLRPVLDWTSCFPKNQVAFDLRRYGFVWMIAKVKFIDFLHHIEMKIRT